MNALYLRAASIEMESPRDAASISLSTTEKGEHPCDCGAARRPWRCHADRASREAACTSQALILFREVGPAAMCANE